MALAFWNMNSHWPVSYEMMYSNDEHKWFKWWTWEMLIETRELKVEVRLTLGLKDIKCIINCYDYLLDWVHMLDALLFIDWIHLIHSSIDILLSSPHETFVSLWAFASQSLCLTFTPIIPSHFHWQSWMGTCQVHHILLSSRDSVSLNSNEMKWNSKKNFFYFISFILSIFIDIFFSTWTTWIWITTQWNDVMIYKMTNIFIMMMKAIFGDPKFSGTKINNDDVRWLWW